MTKPIWYIERDVYDDGVSERMMEVVQELGMEGVWFRYPGFGGDIEAKKVVDGEICAMVYRMRAKNLHIFA